MLPLPPAGYTRSLACFARPRVMPLLCHWEVLGDGYVPAVAEVLADGEDQREVGGRDDGGWFCRLTV
jgi:hypothetical protein